MIKNHKNQTTPTKAPTTTTFPPSISKDSYQAQIIKKIINNPMPKSTLPHHQPVSSQAFWSTNCKNCFKSPKSVRKSTKPTSRRSMSSLMKWHKITSRVWKSTRRNWTSTWRKRTRRSKPSSPSTSRAKCLIDNSTRSALSINKNYKSTTLQFIQASKTLPHTTTRSTWNA